MRARLASIALTALSLISVMAPANATRLTRDVAHILNAPVHQGYIEHTFLGLGRVRKNGCLTQSAVIAPACVGVGSTCDATTMPTALANAGCNTAILTAYPSDIEERRLSLEKQIAQAEACGRLNACEISDLKAGMAEINAADIAYRNADRELSIVEARRLYKAMDRVNSDLNWYNRNHVWDFVADRGPVWFY